jgi:hypothetical protein
MKLPQLSLRELFLLVALAAMGCGWWVDHIRLTAFGNLWHKRAKDLKWLVELPPGAIPADKRFGTTVIWEPDGNSRLSPSLSRTKP